MLFHSIQDTDFESSELNDMEMVKGTKRFNILKNGKKLWIKSHNLTIKYPFAVNTFKKTEDGTVVFNIPRSLTDAVNVVDKFVLDEFLKLYSGQILNNVVMTENTIKMMCRSSLYGGTLRVCVSNDSCTVFDEKQNLIETPKFSDILHNDLRIAVIVEPAFAWMMNGKIGIHWDARQIRILSLLSVPSIYSVQESSQTWSLGMDDEEDVPVNNVNNTVNNVNVPVNNVNVSVNNVNVQKIVSLYKPEKTSNEWSLEMDDGDDEPKVFKQTRIPVEKKKMLTKKKMEESKSAWSLKLDDDDDKEGKEEEAKDKHKSNSNKRKIDTNDVTEKIEKMSIKKSKSSSNSNLKKTGKKQEKKETEIIWQLDNDSD